MEYFLFTSRKVGVRSNPPRKSRIGIVSPEVTGQLDPPTGQCGDEKVSKVLRRREPDWCLRELANRTS